MATTIEEKFPNAHPDFFKLYKKFHKAAGGNNNLFHITAAAHEIMAKALMLIAETDPDHRRRFAEQLRITADWCEFMPPDLMCSGMTGDEVQALIEKHRLDPD